MLDKLLNKKAETLTYNGHPPMAILRRKKQPRPLTAIEVADIRESLQKCLDKIAALERERETDIQRMGAMQAEIDHLRAILGRSP